MAAVTDSAWEPATLVAVSIEPVADSDELRDVSGIPSAVGDGVAEGAASGGSNGGSNGSEVCDCESMGDPPPAESRRPARSPIARSGRLPADANVWSIIALR
jgi:hypothetical protein